MDRPPHRHSHTATRLGPRGLLQYNEAYGVLICRDCRYAIQKNALQSHLLRHKIYRDERHNLLLTIADLEILEPDDVPLPSPTSQPIDGLPVFSGYRCVVSGCGHLCASSKRMKRHQGEVHDSRDVRNLASVSRPVQLQTFFRGTKLRYFEVTPLNADAGVTAIDDDREENADVTEPLYETAIASQQLPSPSCSRTVRAPPRSPDLETLTYFHHFITATSLNLPPPSSSTGYWQTDVVGLALQRKWLMSGLLAISTLHLAFLEQDVSTRQIHRGRSTQFAAQFIEKWAEIPSPSSRAACTTQEEITAGERIVCVLRCGQWTLPGGSPPLSFTLESLRSLLSAIKAFAFDSAAQSDGEPRNPSSNKLQSLHTLPSRMAETFGKPENVEDVLATLEAISGLIECCEVSFSSDCIEKTWSSMEMWLSKVPEYFRQLVERNSPPALVVIAHWAALLVKRAGNCGCWFLEGVTEKVVLLIKDEVSQKFYGRDIECLLPEI
ncbi:uncharacterized protein BJX67DRAFT_347564 [Aspergillus lucknowensis]|uniref:C2H2-type domain-containing protein n=1 Tax=Aspergillus lucknowensis TaxID=176173 RepID=A0ABR4M1W6_9EURO